MGTWVSSLFLLLEGSPLLNVLYSSTITVAGGPFVSPDTIWLGAETPMPLPPAQSPWSGGAHGGAGQGPTPASTSGLTLDAKRGRPVPAAGSGLWQVPAPAPSHPRVVRDVCRGPWASHCVGSGARDLTQGVPAVVGASGGHGAGGSHSLCLGALFPACHCQLGTTACRWEFRGASWHPPMPTRLGTGQPRVTFVH